MSRQRDTKLSGKDAKKGDFEPKMGTTTSELPWSKSIRGSGKWPRVRLGGFLGDTKSCWADAKKQGGEISAWEELVAERPQVLGLAF